jgi:putative DNA primase/helicase
MSAQRDFAALPPGSHRKPCPCCQKRSTDKTLSVTVDSQKAIWHCFRCGLSGRTNAARGGTSRPLPVSNANYLALQGHETLSPFGQALWQGCSAVAGEARAYLEARNCVIPPADGDLRWHPNLRHPSGYIGPTLVGLITDAVTNVPLSLHQTWIRPDGTKAQLDAQRLLLKGHRKTGGVIRLWPDEAVTGGLAIAEGVETALSAAHAFTPVWSCIDCGNLAKFPVLAGVECLSIVADNDAAGMSAARRCGERWAMSGAKAWIIKPAHPGTDLNDMLSRGVA